jgi:eukaryotic-like serine/threonine-protein kinase
MPMDAARWREIEDIYHSALSRPPEDRPAFLREVCGGDSELQQRVASLLDADDQAGDFLELPALEDAATERAPQIQIGSYRILHRLGAGGMGEVYRAHDAKLGRDVAMKTLASEFARDADRIARLRREARTLAAVNHPNLAAIHDLIETAAGCYLVLELVEGETLRGPLPLDKALDYARQVAAGLHAAHSKGIVHRDLKPSNVIVTPEGRVKVLDFGLAKAVSTNDDSRRQLDLAAASNSATLTGQIVGTPPYMSPEQIGGEAIDKRTDIWAFGCLLYELLAGRRAFDGKTVPQIVEAVLAGEPDWSLLPPKTPARIRLLLRQCLTKDPARRPPDIAEVGAAVESVISAWRGRRHQRIVAAAVTVTALLAIVTAALLPLRRGPIAGAQHIQSILVIPFENETRDPNAEYLSDGIAEGLIGSLAALPDVRVVARTTAFRFKGKPIDLKDIRKQLDVDALITGRLLSRGNDIVVQADLIDVKSGNQLWASRFHDQNANVLEVEQSMVARISQALRGRLTSVPAAATMNPDAYKLYLEGRFYWSKRNPQAMARARELFQRAIAIDPKFARAYSGFADATHLLGTTFRVLPREEAVRLAREAAGTSIRLAPDLAEGHASLGLIYMNEFRWTPAEAEFKRAIALNPNDANALLWYSLLLLARGLTDESLAVIRRAERVDPLSAIIVTNVAMRLEVLGDYDGMLPQVVKALDLDPEYAPAYLRLGAAYEGLGDAAKAVTAYRQGALARGVPGHQETFLIRAHALLGNIAEAKELITLLEQRATRGELAYCFVGFSHSAMGDRDSAIWWLTRALEAREPVFRDNARTTLTKELRGDPRYEALLERLARGFED